VQALFREFAGDLTRPVGLLRRYLDSPLRARADSRHWPAALRWHNPGPVTPVGLGGEADPLRPRPQVGENNGRFAERSSVCRRAACSWLKIRRTCCCSLRCGPVGRREADRRRSASVAGMHSGDLQSDEPADGASAVFCPQALPWPWLLDLPHTRPFCLLLRL